MMFISSKGKDDYLTSAVVPQKKKDANYKIWKAENNMVMTQLINAMDDKIGQNF